MGDPHGRAFGVAAEAYDRYRPAPAPEALDWLLRAGDRDVVDVGAGTGQLTRLLLERGLAVTAVEPDRGMREVLAWRAPRAAVVAAVAESLPVPDASQDAVLAHAAWHWFDAPRAISEAARVLRPGGRLGALRTGFDPEVAWLDELWERLEPDPAARRPGGRVGWRLRGASWLAGRRVARRFGRRGAPFAPREEHVARFARSFTVADLLGLMGTYSGLLVRSPDERTAAIDRVRELLQDRLGGGDAVEIPMVTRCWRAGRRASPF